MAASVLRLPIILSWLYPEFATAAVSHVETDRRLPRKVHYTAVCAVFQGKRDDFDRNGGAAALRPSARRA
jgi:hypothetical protein